MADRDSEMTEDVAFEPGRDGFQLLTAADWARVCEALPANGPSTRDLARNPQFSVAVGRLRARDGRPEQHLRAARIFVIRQGTGLLRIGGVLSDPELVAPGELLGSDATYFGYELVPLEPGTIVSIERGTAYQLLANEADFSFLVIRINH